MNNLKNILDYKPVVEEELPEIDLYMDQVTGYLDKILKNFKAGNDDKILTKTMINNYVKAKIVNKPIKKKYNGEHLMSLIMIYHLKNIISINEINQLIELLSQEEISTLYNRFNEIQGKVLENNQNLVDEIYSKVEQKDKLNVAVELILEADIKKRMGEALLRELAEVEAGPAEFED